MDESLLLIIAASLLVIGFIGAFIPVMPDTLLAWGGLVAFKYTHFASYGWGVLSIGILMVLVANALEYYIPIYGSQKMGGTKYGVFGATAGLVIGLFFPPFGVIIGSFVGAFAGELYHNSDDTKKALKAATGAFIGFLVSTGINVMVTVSFIALVLWHYFN